MLHESPITDCELVFDAEGTLTRYGGSRDLLVDMIGFFREDAPKLVVQLRQAASAGDAPSVRDKSHALKGLLAGCGGKRAAHAAQRIENAGAAGDLTDIELQLGALDTQIELLHAATANYRA